MPRRGAVPVEDKATGHESSWRRATAISMSWRCSCRQAALPPFAGDAARLSRAGTIERTGRVLSQSSWQPPPEQLCLQSEPRSQSKLQPPPGSRSRTWHRCRSRACNYCRCMRQFRRGTRPAGNSEVPHSNRHLVRSVLARGRCVVQSTTFPEPAAPPTPPVAPPDSPLALAAPPAPPIEPPLPLVPTGRAAATARAACRAGTSGTAAGPRSLRPRSSRQATRRRCSELPRKDRAMTTSAPKRKIFTPRSKRIRLRATTSCPPRRACAPRACSRQTLIGRDLEGSMQLRS